MYLYLALGPELEEFMSLCKSRIAVSPANLGDPPSNAFSSPRCSSRSMPQ